MCFEETLAGPRNIVATREAPSESQRVNCAWDQKPNSKERSTPTNICIGHQRSRHRAMGAVPAHCCGPIGSDLPPIPSLLSYFREVRGTFAELRTRSIHEPNRLIQIAPSSDEVDKLHASQKLVPGWSMTAPFPTISAAHTNNMMMAPQMTANTTTMPQMPMSTTHARVSFPMMACNNNNNQVPAAAPNPSQMNPIIMSPSYPMHFLVPASHQHPQQVHGMGGRPVHMIS